MSYVGVFGTVESWNRIAAETDEVYLWRARFSGADIRSLEDMQAIAAAIGSNQGLGLDLRGIAVQAAGPGNVYDVDAALTSKTFLLYTPIGFNTAADIAQKVQVALADRFPSLTVGDARFDEINDTDPKHPALDFWLYSPVIWDIPGGAAFPHLEKGVPTHAFERFEGLYRGTALDGANLKKWQQPGSPGSEPGSEQPTSEGDTTLLWVAGGLVALWFLSSRARKTVGAAT